MSLEGALYTYIANEERINGAEEKENQLLSEYEETLKLREDGFTVDEAEETYAAYKALDDHRANKSHFQEQVDKAGAEIKKYLDILKPSKILYTYKPLDRQPLTYAFTLNEKGEVTHNRKNKANNKDNR